MNDHSELDLAAKRESLGLARYDAMCQAIALCHNVDEVKDLRDKAKALQVYAQQARNVEAERKAAEVRIRAERRAGEILREMKEMGQRATPKDGNSISERTRATSRPTRLVNLTSPQSAPTPQPAPTLADLNITRDQSSKWQKLAEVPAEDFEKAVTDKGPTPTTEGIINAYTLKENPMPRIDPDALWIWGRIRDIERMGLLSRSLIDLIAGMPPHMRQDCEKLLPKVIGWLQAG